MTFQIKFLFVQINYHEKQNHNNAMSGLKKASNKGGKQQSIHGFLFKSNATSRTNEPSKPLPAGKPQFVPPKVATSKPVATVKPVSHQDQSPMSSSSIIDLTSTSPVISRKNSRFVFIFDSLMMQKIYFFQFSVGRSLSH